MVTRTGQKCDMKSSREHWFHWLGDKKMDLYVRSCGEFILYHPDRERYKYCKDFGEIFWPVDGECIFRLDEKEYTLERGNIWYYPPGSWHDYFPKEHFHYCWLSIAGKDAVEFFKLMKLKPGLNKAGVCPKHLFLDVGNNINSLSLRQALNALATAFKIVASISIMTPEVSQKTDKVIVKVQELIDSNYSNPELTVEQIAMDIGMHRGSLSRSFRKNYGVTISDYIISSRIRKAVDLLISTDYSIAEITVACGMNSPHYFSKVFAKKTGLYPSEFRKRYARKQ